MKQNRGYPQLTVTKRAEHSIIKGHPWVYYNEITAEQPFADGELVDVVSQKSATWAPALPTATARFGCA